jgi:hypothetical protein
MPTATPNPEIGILAKLGIGAAPGPATVGLDFQSETLVLEEEFGDPAGLRGSRSHPASRVRPVRRRVTGGLTLQPTAAEFAAVMPYVMGGVVSGNNIPLGEVLPLMAVQVVRGAGLFTYATTMVNRATIRGTPGGRIGLELDLLGLDEAVGAASSFPSLSLDGSSPFTFGDAAGGFTLNGTTINVFSVAITIDNAVQAREVNSLTPTVLYSTDRIISWDVDLPFGDAEAMYGLAAGGVPVSIAFTNGGLSATFASPKLQVPRRSPNVADRNEIHLRVQGVARMSAANNDELTCVVDAVP